MLDFNPYYIYGHDHGNYFGVSDRVFAVQTIGMLQ